MLTAIYLAVAVSFILLALYLVPLQKENAFSRYPNLFPMAVTGILFCLLLFVGSSIYANFRVWLGKRTLTTGETALLNTFVNKLRFCYSLEDFTTLISEQLEQIGDCSVLYIDRETNYVLYNSPSRLTSDPETAAALRMNFSADWAEGLFFLGSDMGVVSTQKRARGFFLSGDRQHLFVFCRYMRLFDTEIYRLLYDEFRRFQMRRRIISGLSEIAELSKEWEQLAAVQRAFLPQQMPEVKGVRLAAYFRPLINVSGDYYTVLPIDEDKTLVMLGDVSGKGLAAALVMGLVMNTVKIMENKEDLPGMLVAVDAAIKSMRLQDKYTVVFIGIIDTAQMKIRYINASMSDPIIITRSPTGHRIKPLTSNCSLVGILPLDDVTVAEQRLFSGDVIMMASDGVSEVMNDEGVELGDTDVFDATIKRAAGKEPQEFIDDVVSLIFDYNGNKKLRDDVTMLVAKVQG